MPGGLPRDMAETGLEFVVPSAISSLFTPCRAGSIPTGRLAENEDPAFYGYCDGKWIDEDGGSYDVLSQTLNQRAWL
jgi:hypothetical protein